MAQEELEDLTLLGLLGDKTESLKQLLATYALGKSAYNLVQAWVQRTVRDASFTVAINEDDPIYPQVHSWLMEKIPGEKLKALTVSTKSQRKLHRTVADALDADAEENVQFYYDDSRTQTVRLGGYRIKVALERPEKQMKMQNGTVFVTNKDRIIFTTRTVKGRKEVINFLSEIANVRQEAPPSVKVASTWGDWKYLSADIPARPLDSVVLKTGQKATLIGDMERFLNAEKDYVRLGIPYHRGYLFYGPPGTGKTSAAKAISNHLGMDIYYVSLPSIQSDSQLVDLLQMVDDRSMVLLEDVDIVHSSRVRDDTEKGVTLAGLLNALDGMVTPHGIITVMTTNNKDILDDALVRPGRVDYTIEMGYIDKAQLVQLMRVFLDVDVSAHDFMVTKQVTPAEVIELVLKNINNNQKAVKAIMKLVQ